MAVKVRIQEDTMISIADAIREKDDANDKYYPSEMASKIHTLAEPSLRKYIEHTVDFVLCNADQIMSYKFYKCSALTEVSFPACTSIGSSAFAYCSALTEVSFPACTSIGSSAFQQCSALTEVSFPACTSIGNYAFQQCSALTEVSFPACTSIGSSAFAYCSALTEVSFPACTSIGSSAFAYCSALESAYFMASSVIALANRTAFNSTPMSVSSYLGYYGSIYVPLSLADDYMQASNWSYYSERIVGV